MKTWGQSRLVRLIRTRIILPVPAASRLVLEALTNLSLRLSLALPLLILGLPQGSSMACFTTFSSTSDMTAFRFHLGSSACDSERVCA